jgi:two-component system CheB/CheR fusion protein
MPVMDGFEVLTECRRNPYLRNTPIIVLAGGHQEKLTSLKLGADDFLPKPYNAQELELRITKLVQARRAAQSAKQAKNEFLAIASHELRTPMHHIMGLSELLDGEMPVTEAKELIGLLKGATDSLTGLITDILNYVQLDTVTASALLEPFSLRAAIQGALEALHEAAQQKGVQLHLDIKDATDALNGHSFYVYKVFSILIGNAIKFSTESDVHITIREEALGSRCSRFLCSVIDQGSGIPAEFREKIFEPFVQVDQSCNRNNEGLGMGLAIARRMLELMGGDISVSNNVDKGSTFSFSFQCDIVGTA